MKLRKLMFGALACLAFAACSDDNDVVNNVNNGADGDADQMVKINIVAPAGTRAPGGYQDGTDAENAVSSAVFVFFNNGEFVQASHASQIDFTFNNSTENTVEKISQAVVILNEPEVLPNQVVAILNGPLTKAELNDEKPDLTELRNLISDCRKTGKGEFVMSNSVWAEDFAAEITLDNLVKKENTLTNENSGNDEGENADGSQTNGNNPDEDDIFQLTKGEEEALAKAAIVNIYVERVLAKVNVTIDATQEDITADDITITSVTGNATDGYTTNPGEKKTLVPVIKGLHLSYCSPASYLLKQYDATGWKGAADAWKDAANFRSYWGKSIPAANWKEGFSTTETTFAWRHKQYSNVKKAEAKGANAVTYEFYTQENTSSPEEATTSTKLVITAQLTTDGTTSVGDLVKYKGLYYSEEDFLKIAAQKLIDGKFTFKVNASDASSNDWLAYLKSTRIAGDKAWEIRIVTKSDVKDFAEIAKEGSAYTTVAEGVTAIEEYLMTEIGKAWEWQDGRCYYYVDIEHLNKEAAIIRNHVYQLRINSISGMGTPVYDPDKGDGDENGEPDEDTDKDDDPADDPDNPTDKDPEGGDEDPDGKPDPDDDEDPIIPEKPTEDAFYVSAKLNILKWAIVPEQKVDIK